MNILAVPWNAFDCGAGEIGVARVSVGSGFMRATLGLLRRAAAELKSAGTYGVLSDAMAYADVNKMLGG